MENNHAEKSQAEIYREERKKRMESAAKKNAKKSPQLTKAKRIVGKTIAIILAVAIGLGAIYGVLNFFGVPQKVLPAAKIGNEKVSIAKYNFYYMELYLSIYNQAKQYDMQSPGAGQMYTGYDSTKTPMEQAYTRGTVQGFEGQEATWADYLRVTALEQLQSYTTYAKLAREAGLEIDEESQKKIDDEISSLRKTAETNDYSLDRFLTKNYGKGVGEKLLREVMEERVLAAKFVEDKTNEVVNSFTAEQIQAEYDENIAEYAMLSVHGFVVNAKTSVASDATDDEKAAAKESAMAVAKEQAESYAAGVHNAETLYAQAKANNASATEASVKMENTTANTLKNTYSEAAKDWALASDRKVGDVTVVETANGYAVLYMAALPHKDTVKPVNVRHILVQFDTTTDENGKTVALTDAQKAVYKQQADALLAKYQENPTEENFAALATENTDDSGSKNTGGLYENVKEGDMVTEFNDWCFDAARRPGDTDIVETQYGYHIMYYVNNDNEETWMDTVRQAMASEALTDFDKEVLAADSAKVEQNSMLIKWAAAQLEKIITLQYIQY